jgi:hypothetical protein
LFLLNANIILLKIENFFTSIYLDDKIHLTNAKTNNSNKYSIKHTTTIAKKKKLSAKTKPKRKKFFMQFNREMPKKNVLDEKIF